ncbi:hypothetical protein BH11PSE12_BH11PSE12_14810 [soil metagenome]
MHNHQNSVNAFNPFPSFSSIKWRANYLLKNRTENEIENAIEEVMEIIDTLKQERISNATKKYIQRLAEHGGWELDYLDHRSNGSEDDIRELLNNWPSHEKNKPTIPIDQLQDQDALENAIDNNDFLENFISFEDPLYVELLAVLALKYLEEVELQLYLAKKVPSTKANLNQPFRSKNIIQACNILISTTEIIAHAERTLSTKEFELMQEKQGADSTTKCNKDKNGRKARCGSIRVF